MARKADIDKEMLELGVSPDGKFSTPWQSVNEIRALVRLKYAVTDLDRTSTILAVANIIVGVVLAALASVQIALMIRGH